MVFRTNAFGAVYDNYMLENVKRKINRLGTYSFNVWETVCSVDFTKYLNGQWFGFGSFDIYLGLTILFVMRSSIYVPDRQLITSYIKAKTAALFYLNA